jgi:hypothetical protein
MENFDEFVKTLIGIREKYPNKLIEIDGYNGGCQGHGDGEYCYCPSTSWDVNVYDVPKKKEKKSK